MAAPTLFSPDGLCPPDASAPLAVPVLETERLRLRGHRLDDFGFFETMWADPAVTRYIGEPRDREVVWGKFLSNAGQWALIGYGFWAVEEKATGALIGEAGLGDFQRHMTPSIAGEPEAGWVFTPPAHGRGYATEAVSAIVRWADAHLDAPRTTCIFDPDHKASQRVAEKCGYRREGLARYHDEDVLIMARPHPGKFRDPS